MTHNYRKHSGYPLCIQMKFFITVQKAIDPPPSFVLNIWELGILFDALCDIRVIVCCDNMRHSSVETMSNMS